MAVALPRLPERYQHTQPIARGGMGAVYRAYDTTLGRAVAIKVLDERYAEDPELRARFKREGLAAARLSGHAASATIYDVGETDGRPYIVMEYLPGGSVEERLRGGRPPLGTALHWLEQAATALDAAHAAGVVHRDVKPGNLLLDADGNVHVGDFGIASAAGLDSVTRTGTVLGTAAYLSPEQAAGARVTAASDRYALAVVAYELLTGRRPFERESIAAEAAAHVHEPVPSVTRVAPSLPRGLDRVFQRALAKEPAHRFPSCIAFVAALRSVFEDAERATRVLAQPARPMLAPPRRRRTSGRVVAVLLGALLLGAGLAAALLLRPQHKTPAPVAKPVVHTVQVTVAGRSQTVTVTQAAPAPVTVAAPAPVTPTPAGSAGPHALNDRAYAMMKAGDFTGALPLLQDAVRRLQGSGPSDPYEAYADYNLGFTLVQLGRCPEGLPYLQRADALEPGNAFVKHALQQARKC